MSDLGDACLIISRVVLLRGTITVLQMWVLVIPVVLLHMWLLVIIPGNDRDLRYQIAKQLLSRLGNLVQLYKPDELQKASIIYLLKIQTGLCLPLLF